MSKTKNISEFGYSFQVKFIVCLITDKLFLEQIVDILDEKYSKMNEVLLKPVFFDSVEIRQVIADIKSCHTAILAIANKLTRKIGTKSDNKTEKEDSKKSEKQN